MLNKGDVISGSYLFSIGFDEIAEGRFVLFEKREIATIKDRRFGQERKRKIIRKEPVIEILIRNSKVVEIRGNLNKIPIYQRIDRR